MSGTGNRVGGLVGRNRTGLIIGSYTTGEVQGDHRVGGLVGENTHSGGGTDGGVIAASFSTATVRSVSSSGSEAGGLVGALFAGEVRASYATGSVIATGSNAGGLVGVVGKTDADINRSYALGGVYASGGAAGALVGLLQSPDNSDDVADRITHSYGRIAGHSDNANPAVGTVRGQQRPRRPPSIPREARCWARP